MAEVLLDTVPGDSMDEAPSQDQRGKIVVIFPRGWVSAAHKITFSAATRKKASWGSPPFPRFVSKESLKVPRKLLSKGVYREAMNDEEWLRLAEHQVQMARHYLSLLGRAEKTERKKSCHCLIYPESKQ